MAAGKAGSIDAPINQSKGCGGVMRIAPIGLVPGPPPEERFGLGCEAAALTHGHPSGYLAAGFLAAVVGALIDGVRLERAIDEARNLLEEKPDHDEVLQAVDAAVDSARTHGLPSPEQIEEFGAGWVAEEALGIALWCSLAADDFLDGVSAAVTHAGDSDSTGAIAGNILGALLGEGAIPMHLRENLVERGIVERIADDLNDLLSGDVTPDDAEFGERYPGW
jgi:ADP-ribosylglycohydrolase